MPKLIEALAQRPVAAFAAFLTLHVAVWTALPAALFLNLPLDLIEALTYGREWQLGYDKLPPLPWWLVEIAYRLFGHDVSYYLLAQLSVIAAFTLVWTVARQLVGPLAALVAILIIDGLHFFTFTAPKFNHDVVQLPLWALAGCTYWLALRRGRMMHWAMFGLAIGISLWAKYFMVVLAVPLALFLLLDHDARKTLASPGPWIAAAVALLVMAPHIVWLVQNDFLPFAYADMRATPARGPLDHVLHPIVFAAGQLAFALPALLIAAPLVWPRPKEPAPSAPAAAFDRRIVTLLAFGPAATVTALSFITGRGTVALWGYPLWLFLGLWIVLFSGVALDRARLGRVVALWAIVFSGFAAAFIADYTVMQTFDHRYRAAFYPGDRLAAELAARFRALTGRPLAYVIGTMWTGGNVAHYARERPRVLIDGDPRRAPWIDLGDLRSKGAIVVWDTGDPRTLPTSLRAVADDAELQEPLVLPFRRGEGSVTAGWAVLRPQPAVASRDLLP
jgi:4-amino-4-deoxy-L-arabinose transferase-like glycosyltransferase